MSSTPPDAPAPSTGPRVTRDQVTDLARLRRTTGDRKIAGVCGGLGRHLDVDPLLLRVGFVVLALFGAGFLMYAALWLLVPDDASERARIHLEDRNRAIAIAVVGGVGALSLLGNSWGFWDFPWPMLVVGLVVFLLVRGSQSRPQRSGWQGWQGPPDMGGPGQPVDLSKGAPGQGAGPPPGGHYGFPPPVRPVVPPRPNPRKRGPLLFLPTLALVALSLGVVGMVDVAGSSVAAATYPAVALGAIAVMLLVGAFYGRAGGLIVLGLLTTLALFATAASDHWEGRPVIETPTSASQVDRDYWLPAGELVVDLSKVSDPQQLEGDTLNVGAGTGRVEVIVPEGIDVTVKGEAGLGDLSVLGRHSSGADLSLDGFVDGDPRSTGPADDLTIKAFVGLGEIEVRQQ